MLRFIGHINLFLIFFISVSFAADNVYLFKNINKNIGLSNNNVNYFLKDRSGFLWIATTEGLNRFDGYKFRTYENNINDSASIADNSVSYLFEDHKGKIWVMAGDYLDIFDPITNVFHHSQSLFEGRIKIPLVSRIRAVTDKNGNIWVGNTAVGLYKYNPKNDSVFKISSKGSSFEDITSDSILSIAIDSKNYIWVTNNKCYLEKIDNEKRAVVQRIALPYRYDGFFTIFIDSDDDIWMYDANHTKGFYQFDQKLEKLNYYGLKGTKIALNSEIVTGFCEDESGLIWIGTDHGGLNLLDKKTFTVKTITSNPLNKKSIAGNTITTLYKDNDGFIWVGTFKNGVSYYHKSLFNFNLFQIQSAHDNSAAINDIDNFAEDKRGNIWIGTNGAGLFYFDRTKNSFIQYKHEHYKNSISANVIIGMLSDNKDRLWLGTYFGGLNMYKDGIFKVYKNDPNNPLSLSDDRVWDICEDNDGDLWVGTLLGGINIIDGKTEKIKKIIKGIGTSPLNSNVVFDIYKDQSGVLWFATVDGLRSYNKRLDKWTEYKSKDGDSTSLSKNFVYTIIEDSRGWIWVGTSSGLNLLNREQGKFRVFKKREGFASDVILTILEDHRGNLWMGTTQGLSNMVIIPGQSTDDFSYFIRNYDEEDGLQGEEFNEKSAIKTSNDELIFGGNNGFNLFNPEQIQMQNIDAKVFITDFEVFNKSVEQNGDLRKELGLKKSVSYAKKIDLQYDKNVFSLEFSCLNYFLPERRRYKYKLEGFNKNWLTTDGNNRKVTYTNLDPGEYSFKVIATNTNGEWDRKETQLKIVIHPPWWDTKGFKIILIFLIISIGLTIYYERIKRLRRNQKILEQMVRERTIRLEKLNDELHERQEEISVQNEELEIHRNRLENLVEERTSELNEAKKRAEQSDKLKSAFLANMSHEIRTPMNAIIGFSSLLKDKAITNEEKNEFVDVIQNNCESLLVIINDILDISKIEADQVDIHRQSFEMNQILKELQSFYVRQQNESLKIILDINTEKPLLVYTDLIRFKQVLQNLINNAIKFTHKGEVRYGYRLIDGYCQFFVSDTGIGIKSEDYDKLFEQFSKINTGGLKFFKGTGLGLAISKKLVELLGGKIWVDSIVGNGTTFYFTLPVVV
ncbi:MAG: hypothetical protein JW717_03730 [Marinilabiliaceae bacterium]|nr:hypothetical protein [Marinilabiliaceae bacterium]